MENLLDIIENAVIRKENTSYQILKRYGCDVKQKEMALRTDLVYSEKNTYSVFHIVVNPVNTTEVAHKEYCIYRNSPLASILLQKNVGDDYEFIAPGQGDNAGLRFYNHGDIYNVLDLQANTINIKGEKMRTFKSLKDFFNQLAQTKEEREAKIREQKRLEEERIRAEEEAKSAQEKKRITDAINKVKKQINELEGQFEEMLKLTKYIHNHAQLRFHPIVDVVQSRIKFNNLYNGVSVVISGGPGTGKTTTMISRLKYLTDIEAINQDAEEKQNKFNLTVSQRDTLVDLIKNDKDWVFFSPSQLLKEYLAKAMEGERLSKPSMKTQNWTEFINKMMRQYGFFSLDNEASAFKRCRDTSNLIYNGSNAIVRLTDFYLRRFYEISSKLPTIDIYKDYKWKNLAKFIESKLSGASGCSLDQIIDIFNLLKLNVYEECINVERELENGINEKKKERVLEIYGAITQNKEHYQNLLRLLIRNDENKGEPDDENPEDAPNDNSINESEEQRVYKLIERTIVPYARSIVDRRKRLTERQKIVSEILLKYFNEDDKALLAKIGEYSIFKDFTKYVNGPARIMLQGFSTLYKQFRKGIVEAQDIGWNQELLPKIVSREKELHIQEQALLLGFINNIVRAIQKKNGNNNVVGRYAELYNEYKRPIIGIDEATDFSEVEIYAMTSFAHNEFSSITLAGDLMQRMTDRGLKSWDELIRVLPQYKVEQLTISYRQSKKMLDVALRLYKDTIGQEAKFKSHLKESGVPSAIALIDEDEDVKISWIEERIKEVYKAYGDRLPSIAIFLNDRDETSKLARELGDKDFFYDNGITVVDCSQGQTIGNTGQVRVFPIELVKGMEFDVVFFHNIDDMKFDNDLIKRYLYVGVSRASFFLGATFKENNPDLTKYFTLGETWRR